MKAGREQMEKKGRGERRMNTKRVQMENKAGGERRMKSTSKWRRKEGERGG